MALLLYEGRVLVVVGHRGLAARLRLGRLVLVVHAWPGGGVCVPESSPRTVAHGLVVLAGPVASAAYLGVLWPLVDPPTSNALLGGALFAAGFTVAASALPWGLPAKWSRDGKPGLSDGLVLLALLLGARPAPRASRDD